MIRAALPLLCVVGLGCGGGSQHAADASADAFVSLNPATLYLASHPPSEIDLYLDTIEPNPF